jgi:hypothetical protein
MASYGEILGNALKFSVHPKRWLPFFVLDSIFFIAAVALVMSNFSNIMSLIMTATSNPATVLSLINFGLILVAGFIVWGLLKIYITAAVVHQSVKPKEFGKSWSVAKSRFLTLLIVVVIVGIISGIVGLVPYIGWILSIIVGLMFFFIKPAVVAKGLGFDNSLRDSYHIFMKHKWTVFLIWVAVAIISIIITFIFFIPLLAIIWGTIAPIVMQVSTATTASLLLVSLMENLPLLIATGEILLIGMAIAEVFKTKAETDFYLLFKKKKFGIF